LKISEWVTRSKLSEQCCSRRPTALLNPPNSCQFEILRPDLFFSLSLSLAVLLSLFLSSTESVASSCVASVSLSLYLKYILCS
jgi:hypothetical protein